MTIYILQYKSEILCATNDSNKFKAVSQKLNSVVDKYAITDYHWSTISTNDIDNVIDLQIERINQNHQ